MKEWLMEVGLKTMGPSAIRGGILGIVAWLIAKQGLLTSYGVSTVGHITTVDWDKASIALIAGLPALIAAVIKMFNYHGQKTLETVTTKGD